MFQFHKGTIKPELFFKVLLQDLSFNSIKVRLNPLDDLRFDITGKVFQFHKGTIKPNNPLNIRRGNNVSIP